MAKPVKGELVILGFDYSPLDTKIAEQARSTADRIRERLTKTLEDLIEVGSDLLAVKEALDHGQFGAWLRSEFGWAERTARNFMSVAERFGKSARVAELTIDPTAAYLLAAPSTPDEARQAAVERAEAGEHVTTAVAKEILAETRKKRPRRSKAIPPDKLGLRLTKVLERYK